MVFEVKTRNAQGKVEFITIEADSRSAVFGELDKFGRRAISVAQLSGKTKPRRSYRSAGGGVSVSSRTKGLAALLLTVVIGVGVYLFVGRGEVEKVPVEEDSTQKTSVRALVGDAEKIAKSEDQKVVRKIDPVLEDIVREHITKKFTGNILEIIGPPALDDDDPDNALRTQVAQDVALILAVEPGEPIPEVIPLGFMFDDAEREACEMEGREYTGDGGDGAFLTSLQKWKISIKEGDSDSTALVKQNLLDAQIEILKGIEDGMSVNDTIREAYEFRVEAAKMRTELIDVIKQIHAEEGDVEATSTLIAEMNKKLAAEGIKSISNYDVFEDEDMLEEEMIESENQPGGVM